MPVSRVELLQFPALISFMSHVTEFNFTFQEVQLFLSTLKINPLEVEIKINFVTWLRSFGAHNQINRCFARKILYTTIQCALSSTKAFFYF